MVGLKATVEPWLTLKRGIFRPQALEDGSIVGRHADEMTQRGQMRRWKVMTRG
jgi:hypothetical protein